MSSLAEDIAALFKRKHDRPTEKHAAAHQAEEVPRSARAARPRDINDPVPLVSGPVSGRLRGGHRPGGTTTAEVPGQAGRAALPGKCGYTKIASGPEPEVVIRSSLPKPSPASRFGHSQDGVGYRVS
jgi:hypothetical protein